MIVLGDNFEPPVVTYLDAHDVEYGDKALPWAESINEA